MAVDLVDDREEVFRAQTFAPVDLVNADGFDPLDLTMRKAPLDKPIHRAIDGFPTGLEGPGGFAPRQAPSPASQEDHHRDGDRTLPIAPREVLDADAMLRTVHPARGVEEACRDAPQWHKAPEAFGQPIITRRRVHALGALAVHGRMSFHVDVDPHTGTVVPEADLPVNETGEMLNPVQDGLKMKLNSWSPGRSFVSVKKPQITRLFRDQLFVFGFVNETVCRHAAGALAEDRALRGRNPSAARSLHTAVCSRAGRSAQPGRPVPSLLQEQQQSAKSQGVWGTGSPISPTNSATEPFFHSL
jgi:hypothetical protein